MVTEFLSQWHSTWAWQGSKLQPQIFKTVEFPSLADVFPTYLSGGIAENLWGKETIPVPTGHSCIVFISSYSKASIEEHPSLLPGQCWGISDLQGFLPPLCCSVTCSSLQCLGRVLPPGQAWVGSPASQAGLQPVPASRQGSAASAQANPDSSLLQKQLSYRNYENLGFPRAYSSLLQPSSSSETWRPLKKTIKSWACEWKFITLQNTKNQELSRGIRCRVYYCFPLTRMSCQYSTEGDYPFPTSGFLLIYPFALCFHVKCHFGSTKLSNNMSKACKV